MKKNVSVKPVISEARPRVAFSCKCFCVLKFCNANISFSFTFHLYLYIYRLHNHAVHPGSSVGIAKGYGLDCRDSNPGKGKIFLFFTAPKNGFGSQPASSLIGTEGRFPMGQAAWP
jgi:hypothetical protein